jgi:hypothetical protein
MELAARGAFEMSEQRISQFAFDPTARCERNPWTSVLHAVVHDLCAPHRDVNARRDAERWVGAFPSSDFRVIATLAGFDPDAVWDKLSKVAALSHDRRPWVRDVLVQVRSDRRNLKKQERAYA